MTATFLLVRHAAHGEIGRVLSGRAAGIALAEDGIAQARRLADRLKRDSIAVVLTSPIQRAAETAAILGDALCLPPKPVEAFTEIDFGAWTGRSFESLKDDPECRLWNEARSRARPPGGESIQEVQDRAVSALESMRRAYAGLAVVVVSHADVIRAALAHYLGLPLDNLLRFEISPASVSALAVGDWGGKVLIVNEVPAG
ncbi:histidine phosphatase family protein [Faunimonas sp. B44]|uniref:histidine phosphatase family protein n=1 Tax=Faunimonas sp. B44 TaxID=3461493 RepID=UPI004044DB7D